VKTAAAEKMNSLFRHSVRRSAGSTPRRSLFINGNEHVLWIDRRASLSRGGGGGPCIKRLVVGGVPKVGNARKKNQLFIEYGDTSNSPIWTDTSGPGDAC